MPKSKKHEKLEKLQIDLIIIKNCMNRLKRFKKIVIVQAKKNILENQKLDLMKEIYKIEQEFEVID